MTETRVLLGFDVGTKRIGVAVGQEITRSSSPLDTVLVINGKPDWPHITRLIEAWHADALVVGLPLQMDDKEQTMTFVARRFANRLRGRYQLPVAEVDERLSSRSANEMMFDDEYMGQIARKKKRGMVDQLAAQVILDTYFSQTS